jgi:hypothetical protein
MQTSAPLTSPAGPVEADAPAEFGPVAGIEAAQLSPDRHGSTNEAILDRRLAEIPASERDDLTIDITPREYVLCRDRHKMYCPERPVMRSRARNDLFVNAYCSAHSA